MKLTVPLVVVLAVVVAAIVGIEDSGPYIVVVVVVGRFVGSIAEVGHTILNWPMVEQILKTHV